MFFMVADVRLVSAGANEPNSGWNGEVPVFDMAGFTLRHLTCIVLSVLRVYMKYTQVIVIFFCCFRKENKIYMETGIIKQKTS